MPVQRDLQYRRRLAFHAFENLHGPEKVDAIAESAKVAGRDFHSAAGHALPDLRVATLDLYGRTGGSVRDFVRHGAKIRDVVVIDVRIGSRHQIQRGWPDCMDRSHLRVPRIERVGSIQPTNSDQNGQFPNEISRERHRYFAGCIVDVDVLFVAGILREVVYSVPFDVDAGQVDLCRHAAPRHDDVVDGT